MSWETAKVSFDVTVGEGPEAGITTSSNPNGDGSFLYGDANLDGYVDVSDAVLVAKYVNADSTGKISEQGLKNADCDGEKGVSTGDVTRILMFIAKLIKADQMGKTI